MAKDAKKRHDCGKMMPPKKFVRTRTFEHFQSRKRYDFQHVLNAMLNGKPRPLILTVAKKPVDRRTDDA